MTTMNVDYYAYPADSADARVDWNRNIEMMEYYAGLFGEYPFMDEKYAIAEFHHGGAMEHQTATSMGYGWITGDNSNDFIVVHELAHSWVGDMITMTEWSHAWCKEGFATYCEALYFEDRYGVDYYHQYMDEMNVMHYAMDRLHNINPPLDGAIYYKGAWVLHMLRHVLGDTDFFDGVYAYTNHPDFRYGVADTDDMCAVFSDVAGTDLTWFFYQWIYSWGYPVYGMHWWAESARSGYDITLRIDQTQTVGPVFKMPIDILIETDLGEERFVVWDSLETQTFSFHVEGEPLDLALDPDDWIICEIEFVGDVRGGDQLRVWLPQNHPNPFGAETWIGFHLESAGPARLDIYDLNGRWVTRLLDGPRVAGPARVRWNGLDARGRRVPPGVYYCRLRAGTEATTRRMLCVR
jgi:aminopeptidase N